MPDAREWLEYFYGHFFDGENPNYVSPPDIDMALAVGLDFRPACLTIDRQNQAQAHYAAYVLDFRKAVKAANISVSSAMQAVISGPAIEIQEGSTRVKYSEKAISGTTGSVEQIQANLSGPGKAYAAWFALWSICATMGLSPVTGEPATAPDVKHVPPGGIITRFGYS